MNLIGKDADYIHPDNLNFNDQNIWKGIFQPGNTDEVFQWATEVGKSALRKLKPSNIKELSAGNSLIRLMNDDGEQLIDKYIRYKENNKQAFEDMKAANLTEQEINIINKCIAEKYYICITQEDMMVLSREVAGFDIPYQHKLRKAVAKKKPELLKEVAEDFYQKGELNNQRKEFLDYCWHLILALKGYGFSDIHADEYSIEGFKSAFLKYYHPTEWECACLNVNAGATDEEDEDSKTSKYGKIAKAIATYKQHGGDIDFPNINKSDFGFTVVDNQIVFGLKPLNHVGDNAVVQIKQNRPYKDFFDFYQKNCWKGTQDNPNYISRPAIMSLIKSGCFDFYNPDRLEMMREYVELARLGKKEKRQILDFEKHEYATLSKKDYETMQEELNKFNKFQWEFQAMNCYLSGTPFDELESKYNITIYDANEIPENREIIIFGSYMDKDDKPDKKYLYVSTKTGVVKCRAYLSIWNNHKDLFKRGTPLIIKGTYRYGALTIKAVKEYFTWFNVYKKNN